MVWVCVHAAVHDSAVKFLLTCRVTVCLTPRFLLPCPEKARVKSAIFLLIFL